MLSEIQQHIQPGDTLVLSGDTLNYPDPHIYCRIIDLLAEKNLRVYEDASGETLAETLPQKPFSIKPNEDELETLCGRTMDTEREVVKAAIKLYERYEIPVIAVSLGSKGSIVLMEGSIYKATPPDANVINTIGCGDCF